jgi:hypothetical protein
MSQASSTDLPRYSRSRQRCTSPGWARRHRASGLLRRPGLVRRNSTRAACSRARRAPARPAERFDRRANAEEVRRPLRGHLLPARGANLTRRSERPLRAGGWSVTREATGSARLAPTGAGFLPPPSIRACGSPAHAINDRHFSMAIHRHFSMALDKTGRSDRSVEADQSVAVRPGGELLPPVAPWLLMASRDPRL